MSSGMPRLSPSSTRGAIRLGVSSCLLGEAVRYDSGHKHDRYVTDVLAGHFDLVSVCPEVESGMGVPRETLRLVGPPDKPQLIAERSGKIGLTRCTVLPLCACAN